MTTTFRHYTNQMRFTEDFHKVFDFLVRINSERIDTPNFLWGRWEWMFSLPYLDTSCLSRIGIWEDGGQIVALATYESVIGEAYFCIDSRYGHLKCEMLDYARNNLCKDGAFRALISDEDKEFQRIAVGQGFRPTQKKECIAQIDISRALSYQLPDGYTISSLADDYDLRKLQRATWRGFDHPGEPPDTEQDMLEQQIAGSGPHRNETLNMKVVAPNGDYASYCGMWHLPGTEYALVEPVCTDPTYRKLGLGKAAVLEAVKRCGKLGAKVAYVGSSQQFYYNIGFYPTSTETWWEIDDRRMTKDRR